MLFVTIDRLAQRYKATPTEILASATSFDLYVANIATQYERRQADIAEGKVSPRKELTEEQMLEMIRKVKEQGGPA